MWMVVYITQELNDADRIGKLLEDADIITKQRRVNNSDDSEKQAYEILVTDSDLQQAHNIIIDAKE